MKTVLITGASGSIGSALAQAYAVPGITLMLQGRNEDRLQYVAQHCREKGAQVIIGAFDLIDIPQLQAWVQDMDYLHPIDLVIANHGMNIHVQPDGQAEPWDQTEKLIDINIRACMALVHTSVLAMQKRGKGQIALMSSLAGFFGLPQTPAYCASKAAVKAYGESLRGWLTPQGIHVTVVMPGYVESEMCDAMPGPKPFLWTADQAAQSIKRRLTTNPARISFPFPLNIGCWLLSVLPPAVSIWILNRMGYRA